MSKQLDELDKNKKLPTEEQKVAAAKKALAIAKRMLNVAKDPATWIRNVNKRD